MYIELAKDIPLLLFISWVAGIRLYGLLFTLGILGTSIIQLPPQLQFLTGDIALCITLAIALFKFVVDKFRGLDNIWDLAQTYLTLPVAILLIFLADVASDMLILCISITVLTIMSKTALRMAVNATSSYGYLVSLAEDLLCIIGLYLVIHQPQLFVYFLTIMILQSMLAFYTNYAYFKGLHAFIYRIFTKSKLERINKP